MKDTFDVLVIGTGIAGATAAIAAAERGAQVALACTGAPFGGSSFFAGTWGLGLVGPASEDAHDVDALVEAICTVGHGIADPKLARTLVEGVEPAVRDLVARGVELRAPDPARADEKDYIPCFDTHHRGWHGLGRASLRTVYESELARLGVALLPHLELADLLAAKDRMGGAVFWNRSGEAQMVRARAVVLATGGYGALFRRALVAPEERGIGQAVALRHGAQLVNLEFMQIMPGLVSPVKNVVFNEKIFKYARIAGHGELDALMEARSEHGPFTASRPDCAVDLAMAAAGTDGLALAFDLPPVLPEFMQTYCDWLAHAFGVSPFEGVRIAPYAHAANGGILIDQTARCIGAPTGLFACGEVTGGMHGADRIGGLASANALVFGRIAGASAAELTLGSDGASDPDDTRLDAAALPPRLTTDERLALRMLMDRSALLDRSEKGLQACLEALGRLPPSNEVQAACAIAQAMLARHESLGAHYRRI